MKTWYSQTGSNDATQTSTGNQPKIYDSATGVVTDNGKPVVEFDADFLTIGSSTSLFNFLHNGTTSSVFVAARFGLVADPNAIYGVYGNNGGSGGKIGAYFYYDDRAASSRNNAILLSIYNGNNGSRVCDSVVNNIATANQQLLVYNEFNADSATLNDRAISGVDGASAVGANTRSGTPTASDASHDMQIGNQGGSLSAVAFKGAMREVIFYSSDQSTNRSGIETNINDFYSIY